MTLSPEPPASAVEVRVVKTGPEREAAFEIRREVFVREQNVPESLELDSTDDTAVHLVALENGIPVGAARAFEEAGVWHIGRVAVLRERRGQRIGAALMLAAERETRLRGAREVVLHAQMAVIPFYERLGYTAEGDPFEEADILHRTMRKQFEGP